MRQLIFVLLLAVTCSVAPEARGQWVGGLSAGVALPAGASDNAPKLSTCFTAGLRGMYFAEHIPLDFTVMLDGVHWMKSDYPDLYAVPLDEGLYAKRYLFFPLTAGVTIPFWSGNSGLGVMGFATVGAYFRNINCLRMAAPGVMDNMEEHGFGMAWKVGVDLTYMFKLALTISYTAFGNPFATGGDPMPAGTGPVNEDGVRRSQPTLEGYGQGFLNVSIGYWL